MISERKGKNGISYRVYIRKKNMEISKTFANREDAELFEAYKLRLIECMGNFDIDIKDRVTLESLYEIKMKENQDKRAISDFTTSLDKIKSCMRKHIFLNELSFNDWVDCLKKLEKLTVFKGADTIKNRRPVSLNTLRRWLAICSSVLSHAISLGISVENHALKIIQMYLNGKIKESKNCCSVCKNEKVACVCM